MNETLLNTEIITATPVPLKSFSTTKKSHASKFKSRKNNKFYKNNTNNGIVSHPNFVVSDSDSYIDFSISEVSNQQFLFNFLQTKLGNPLAFWKALHKELSLTPFNMIKKDNFDLISYAALFDRFDIFDDLVYHYGNRLESKQFEKYILKLSINKNYNIFKTALSFYNNSHKDINNEFLEDFLSTATKQSYRQDNNKLFLSWITPYLSDSLKNNFWKEVFEFKNLSLLMIGLKHEQLNFYLKENQTIFSESIDKSGRKFEIKKALSSNNFNSFDFNSLLADTSDINTFSESLDGNINILNTEVPNTNIPITVKKKRKIVSPTP